MEFKPFKKKETAPKRETTERKQSPEELLFRQELLDLISECGGELTVDGFSDQRITGGDIIYAFWILEDKLEIIRNFFTERHYDHDNKETPKEAGYFPDSGKYTTDFTPGRPPRKLASTEIMPAKPPEYLIRVAYRKE